MSMNTLPSPENLEHLTVIFEIWHTCEMSAWSDAIWATLRTALTDPPNLHSIHLFVNLTSAIEQVLDRGPLLTSLVRERMG